MSVDHDVITLGKRKERDDDGKSQHPNGGGTLFVSNLPYTATSTDIQTLFSDFAPVRSAFVVLENGVSKGVGYVSFAIKGDAATAMEAIEKEGVVLDGRKLRVNWAQQKPKDVSKDESDTGKGESSPKRKNTARHPPRPSIAQLVKDPDAIRTTVISGLPASVDQKTLWKKIRKYSGAERVEMIEGCDGVAHAVFATPADAVHAVDRLHAHTFKGAILSVALKKRLENLERAPISAKDGTENTETASAAKPRAAPSRGSRLIIRNVPWDISETDLRALFLPFGPIYSVTIPVEKPTVENSGETATTNESKLRKPRAKGFAFVWFFSKKDAERAIAGVNGRAVRAGAVGAPTMNKKERARLRRQLRQSKGEDADADDGVGEEKDTGERIVAVDWALSKEKWEEAKAKGMETEGESEDANADGDETSGSDGTGRGPDSEEDSENDNDSKPSDEDSTDEESADEVMEVDGDSDDFEDEARSDAEEARKPILPQTDVGTTLFIRNLPFDATEDELRTLFRTFGPLRYARITLDTESGRSRGTGFVCFWNKVDADKALEQSELLAREAGPSGDNSNSTEAKKKKNPFTLPSLLTPDPSSSLAQPLVLHGRTLSLARAVTRDTASRLAEANLRARERADKRNLYLLREGFPTAASGLTEADRERRQASYDARQRMLKRNLALYVSRTRLSIRGLPLFVSERGLKHLALHAISEFEAEVGRGERAALTEDELRMDGTEDVSELLAVTIKGEEKSKSKGKGKKPSAATIISQAKIVRDASRADALTRAKGGRSKGYGFLELRTHADALRMLRWANANPDVGGLLENWWISELEDHIKALEMQLGRRKKGSKELSANGGGGGDDGDDGEARLKRLKQELERLKTGQHKKTHKPLMIEFSIENSQVVGRRKDKIEASRSREPHNARTRLRASNETEDTSRPPKRRRLKRDDKKVKDTVADENAKKSGRKGHPQLTTTFGEPEQDGPASAKTGTQDAASTTASNKLGILIGRKRHQRKTKRKATT